MDLRILEGVVWIIIAGVMSGTAVVPMKFATRWQWENIWLLFNGLALVVIPSVIVIFTAPQAWNVYRTANPAALIMALFLGLGWGVGATLCGIGYTMLGVGLGMSIILGLAATVGSVLPLVVLFPHRLLTFSAVILYLGILVLVLGLLCSTRAGQLRQWTRPKEEIAAGADIQRFARGDIRIGLPIAIASGILSSMFNLALVFGDNIRQTALKLGLSPFNAVNTLWLPITVSGFLAIFVYCLYLLVRRKTLHLYFLPSSASHWAYVLLMSVLYIGSISVYGLGASQMGRTGAIIGFPMYMSMMIITGNVAGLLTGEWKDAPRSALAYGALGIFALIGSVAIIAVGGPKIS